MVRKNYSRLARVEEKRNVKSAILFGVGSIVILIVFVFFGIPLLVKFAGFVGEIGSSNKPIERNDTTPPAPPRLDSLPDYTNQQSLDVTGTTEAGATAKISSNGKDQEVVADNDGRFTLKINLQNGENTITAIAKDQSGNVSNTTNPVKVVLDKDSPELSIEKPTDGESFFGTKQKNIEVKGKTDPDIEITVNGKLTQSNDDGLFSTNIDLQSGSNDLSVKATDKAGNVTEKNISVNYSE
ncbi:hypothetical protein KW795_01735 [Candidatus Microgenomates bacterium]|nr:hypothetical protein [Candidatus Microgenomates bacterium]